MPRTSHGEGKREQTWQLVATLMQHRGSQKVQLIQDGKGQDYLMVQASLLDLSDWSGLTIDQVRESLKQQLGEPFLGIFTDQQKKKAGRGAERWKFKLTLWSTDLAKNKEAFIEAWRKAKSSNSSQAEKPNQQISSDNPSSLSELDEEKKLIALIPQLQENCRNKILAQHSKMRLLSGKEIRVDLLFVNVWLLDRSPRTLQVSQANLLKTFDLQNDRLGLGNRSTMKPGFEVANSETKLLILGKPGAGKTTFIKNLAVTWCRRQFQSNSIVVLIELRKVQDKEWKLLDAIGKQLEQETKVVKMLLDRGELLVLMDGLDEVPTIELRRSVQTQFAEMSEEYVKNRFIVTCRTQIIELLPVGFTSVEIANFNPEQVKNFVQNWFAAIDKSSTEISEEWKKFEYAISNNPALRELTGTPVLLSLICLVLQDDREIPSQVAWLYKKGINLLLSKWNSAKAINGWEVGTKIYQGLSIDQKEALLIEIAAHKFKNPENFLLFDEEKISTQITQFLKLTNLSDGIAVLKAIEAQHGLLLERADQLWSFSHFTFQEYFTAQWLNQLQTVQDLVDKLTDKKWQEVVKLAVTSQQQNHRLLRLIKQGIDLSVAHEPILQEFLTWILQKAESIRASCKYTNIKFATIRAFYLDLKLACNLDPDFARSSNLDRALDKTPDCILDLDYARDFYRNLNLDLDFDLDCNRAFNLNSTLDLAHGLDLYRVLSRALYLASTNGCARIRKIKTNLEKLKATMPTPTEENLGRFQNWRQTDGIQWVQELRQAAVDVRNISHDLQFRDKQLQKLLYYCEANQFLIELLNIPGTASNDVRVAIEDTLILPWEQLQRWQLEDV